MKSKVKKLEGTARQIHIEMPKETVEKVSSEVLEDIKKNAKIPGFRPGKAPLDIIKKNYEKDAADEIKQRLIPRAYQMALKEHGMDPVSYPEISDVSIGLAGALTFTVKVDVCPEVTLKKYKGFKVMSQKAKVSEEEIEETLNHFREMNADFIDTDGPIKKGEFGVCDVETFVDGESVSKKRENMWIEADKDTSMLGMGEELCGLKKGDKKDAEVTLPENYPDKKYAGKKAVFKVEIKETKEKKLSELNEDFAKKMGKENLEEVREETRSQLLARKEANGKINMKNQIMTQLLKKYTFDLPKTMVNRQLKVLIDKAENELIQKGVDKEEVEAHKEQLKDKLFKEALDKVRLYFILDEVANIENIIVTDEEVDNWLRTLATSYGQTVENVKKYYEEHGLLDGLKEQLREDKTVDFLLAEAVIAEKDK